MKTTFKNFVFIALGVVLMSLASCGKEVECPPIPEPEAPEVDTLTNVQLISTELVNHEYDPTANIVTFTMKAVIEQTTEVVTESKITEKVEEQTVDFDVAYNISSILDETVFFEGKLPAVDGYEQTLFNEAGVATSTFTGDDIVITHTFKKVEVEEIEAFGKKFTDIVDISPNYYFKDVVLKEGGFDLSFEFTFNHEDKTTQAVVVNANAVYTPLEVVSVEIVDTVLLSKEKISYELVNDSVYQYTQKCNFILKAKKAYNNETVELQDIEHEITIRINFMDIIVDDNTLITNFEPQKAKISLDNSKVFAAIAYDNNYKTFLKLEVEPSKVIAFGEEIIISAPIIDEVTATSLEKSSYNNKWYSKYNLKTNFMNLSFDVEALISGAVE